MTYFTHPISNAVLTRDFYYKSTLYVGGQHAACDYIPRGRPAAGEPIRAIAAGVVAVVGWDFYSGFFVAIDHADGWRSTYRHLFGQTPVVVGQSVGQGQIIGNVGNTGWSQGAHLHFDLWNRNRIRNDAAIFFKNGWYALDPELYLEQEEPMSSEHDQHHQQLADLVKNLGDLVNAHMQAHQGTFDPNMRQLNDRVGALEGRSAGGGIKRGDTISIKLL